MKRVRSFQASDKVVLVQPARARKDFRPCPQVGRVYCVREVVECANGTL